MSSNPNTNAALPVKRKRGVRASATRDDDLVKQFVMVRPVQHAVVVGIRPAHRMTARHYARNLKPEISEFRTRSFQKSYAMMRCRWTRPPAP
jgi:hypothetical protein